MPTKIPVVQIDGYQRCSRCPNLELVHVAWMTGGVCWPCFLKGDYGRIREIEVAVGRRRLQVPTGYVGPQPKRKKGSKTTARIVEQCKDRALRRLRNLYPDMYDVLYNEERVKAGLTVIPKRVPYGWLNEVVTTYQASLPYAAAEPGAPDAITIEPTIDSQQ